MGASTALVILLLVAIQGLTVEPPVVEKLAEAAEALHSGSATASGPSRPRVLRLWGHDIPLHPPPQVVLTEQPQRIVYRGGLMHQSREFQALAKAHPPQGVRSRLALKLAADYRATQGTSDHDGQAAALLEHLNSLSAETNEPVNKLHHRLLSTAKEELSPTDQNRRNHLIMRNRSYAFNHERRFMVKLAEEHGWKMQLSKGANEDGGINPSTRAVRRFWGNMSKEEAQLKRRQYRANQTLKRLKEERTGAARPTEGPSQP